MSGAASANPSALPSLPELNALDDADLVKALEPLFEGAPRFLRRLAAARPFRSYEGLFREARAIAGVMPREEQVELLDAHPRIGADPSAVSELSYTEQGYDRAPARADAEVARRLHELNDAYETTFGFRFVVFVAGRPRDEIVPLLEEALASDPDSERARGLDDVVAIARDRARGMSR